MRKDGPLAVDLPGPDRDSPGWVKVGVIAAVGFVIGVAWPRLMGVKLGPNAPGTVVASASASSSASAAPPAVSVAAEAPPASVARAAMPAAEVVAAPAVAALQVTVPRGAVLSCKTSDGDTKKGKECGSLAGLDAIVAPHLKRLSGCAAAAGQSGKLSFVTTTDFPSGRISWDLGKSSTAGNLDGIRACLKSDFAGVTAAGVSHEQARYTVAYGALLASSGDAAKTTMAGPAGPVEKADKPAEPAAATGEARVGWDVALVRDVPKTGAVVARLPRGTTVKLGAVKDGWYAIKYGDGFASEGFVHRGAVER